MLGVRFIKPNAQTIMDLLAVEQVGPFQPLDQCPGCGQARGGLSTFVGRWAISGTMSLLVQVSDSIHSTDCIAPPSPMDLTATVKQAFHDIATLPD